MRLPRPATSWEHTSRSPARQIAAAAGWIVLALPALYQLFLLGTVIAGRVAYPYDLEWMEGGLLHHALRLHQGLALYPPPSVAFIPYLYTPLYPAVLAILGGVFGITYALGRAISVLSLVGIGVVGATSIAAPRFKHVARGPAWAGVVLALGLFAAAFPFTEAWYDLVRADTMFLAIATAGIAAAASWSAQGEGWRGHARVAAVAVILTLGFYTKQTGIFYVGLGGAIVLLASWRRAITYVVVSGVLGLGGTALLNARTHGWYWTYISKIHRAHDFSMHRFWHAYGEIMWHFTALTVVVIATLGVVGYTYLRRPAPGRRRELPRQARPFLLWTAAYAVSIVVGAVGIGTEWSVHNAYIPAFLHGALAAGAALPALAACAGILWAARPRAPLVVHGVPAAAAIALGATLLHAGWEPRRYIPTAADVAAGDKLIARIRALPGDVWVPSHPWYAELAGKQPHVHRMGIKDVTWRQHRTVLGLDEALRAHRFSALVLDNRDVFLEVPAVHFYRPALVLPADERPHLYAGARVVPDSIWLPAVPAAPPPGTTRVFDFEQPSWAGWRREGAAWGDGPADRPQPGQDLVLGATGERFATSMHGGDAATGRLTSPPFPLAGARLSMKLGGGTDATKLRVELWVDGGIAATASVPRPGGDALRTVTLDVRALAGKQAKLVLVDDATAPGGHLDVDDVWLSGAP